MGTVPVAIGAGKNNDANVQEYGTFSIMRIYRNLKFNDYSIQRFAQLPFGFWELLSHLFNSSSELNPIQMGGISQQRLAICYFVCKKK